MALREVEPKSVIKAVLVSLIFSFVFLPSCLQANNSTELPTTPTTTPTRVPTRATTQAGGLQGSRQQPTEEGSGYVQVATKKTTVDARREPVQAGPRKMIEPSSQPNDIVSKFLTYLAYIEDNRNDCEAGTWAVVLDKGATSYGPNRYMRQAMRTVETANFFTRIWRSKALSGVQHNEEFFFNVVASNVENDDDIFAFGNCYDAHEFLDYSIFCPYAYRLPDGGIRVKDLSLAYPYLTNDSEWFFEARRNVERLLTQNRVVINSEYTHVHSFT
ncbi:uncharacterized protein LOC119736991 [Patiria miniata]|uniref:Uncharacterized protein n=1 Tax=Patiria miniata TaxID=46514 RepID=A0A914ASC7_PATMI|nr:uncharacterized protein LOC119736991 [Patiria miniata]